MMVGSMIEGHESQVRANAATVSLQSLHCGSWPVTTATVLQPRQQSLGSWPAPTVHVMDPVLHSCDHPLLPLLWPEPCRNVIQIERHVIANGVRADAGLVHDLSLLLRFRETGQQVHCLQRGHLRRESSMIAIQV